VIRDLGKEKDNSLPRVPKLTDEQLKINDAEQAERAFIPAQGTTYNRALAVIQESESISLKDMVPIQRANYAQALADVGKFKEAAKTAQDRETKAYYKAIDKAVWRNDDDRCGCDDLNTFDKDRNPVTHDRHFVVREIWSEKHGKKMGLYKCNKCGEMNVRE